MTTTVHRPGELLELVGELGSSDRMEIDQSRIDRFAAATDDDQWIHVDPARAADADRHACVTRVIHRHLE